MKIVVTGASGFIGGEIVEFLSNNRHNQIIAIGRSFVSRFQNIANIEYVQTDLTRHPLAIDCDVCIHCAGLADDSASEREFFLHNVYATQQLLSSLKNCQTFIFISSSSVYDFSDGRIKKETDLSSEDKLSYYGKSKLLAEKLISQSDITSVNILRPRAVYGNNDRVLMPRILRLLKGNTFILPGKLNVMTNLTHINNLIEAVDAVITQQAKGNNIYNIADKKVYHLRSIFKAIGKRKKGDSVFFFEVPLHALRFFASVNRILGMKLIPVTKQALEYMSQNSVMDCSKSVDDLGLKYSYDFFGSIDALDL